MLTKKGERKIPDTPFASYRLDAYFTTKGVSQGFLYFTEIPTQYLRFIHNRQHGFPLDCIEILKQVDINSHNVV